MITQIPTGTNSLSKLLMRQCRLQASSANHKILELSEAFAVNSTDLMLIILTTLFLDLQKTLTAETWTLKLFLAHLKTPIAFTKSHQCLATIWRFCIETTVAALPVATQDFLFTSAREVLTKETSIYLDLAQMKQLT